MFRLLTSISAGELFKRQLPAFLIAFLFAELFYKFHSFTLECAAFLATWFVLDGAQQLVFGPPRGRFGPAGRDTPPPNESAAP